MKNPLTHNGVLDLYNPNSQGTAKVQVLYMTHWNMSSFLRVRDSKHLSPIMILMKMTEKFIVGDVIMIKKVQLQPSTMFKDDEILPIIDSDINHVCILEYQVIEKKDKLDLLLSIPNQNCGENSYLNALSLIKNNLIKGDSVAEAFFKEGEKRLQLLRPDCNLLRERGNELFKKQNFCKAILHYDMAKQKDHYDARVWNNSSQAYFLNNEYHKARRDALVALKLDPFNKKAYYRAGRAMERAGDINGALEIIEAGLYVCGKCEDLEKLLNQIKAKKEEQNSNLAKSKKKMTNGESSENGSPNVLVNGNSKKNLKPKESPQKKIKETEPKPEVKVEEVSETAKKNKTTTPTLSLLYGAKMLFEKGKFRNALELYEVANATWVSNNNHINIEVVRYLIDVCKLKLKIEPLEDVKKNFLSLLSKEKFPFMPAIHFWLTNLYEIFEDQDKVIFHAKACLQLLENCSTYSLYWPGLNKEPILETSPDELKKWFSEGTWRSAPLAKCRHVDCITIQNHSLAKNEIYPSDFDFRGYVEIECEELCSICYHRCCWKAMKEKTEGGQLGKKTDKDFLGIQCFTPDCTGKISSIRIYDETSQLRNEIAKDKKEKRTNSVSKPKKKKDKKKSGNQGSKLEEKKRLKTNDPDIKIESEVEIVKEETATKKISLEKPSPSEQISFEGNNFKVLRPNDDAEEYPVTALKKSKNNKKKKKSKQVPQISIGDDIEDRFVHNEYLTRLRALKFQREALESDAHGHGTRDAGVVRQEFVLDPDRPFYLPRHLQENPALLESILQSKMVTTSSSDIDKESIAALLEFMYDWLKAHCPMLITDYRIKDYISENFPPNALAYVNKCGGIRHFLLQSFRFALIDEVVCVNEQVMAAQEAAIQIALEKFKLSKFVFSDGHKAVKLSHLLEDTKSTCSSNSSLSANTLITPTNSTPAVDSNLSNSSHLLSSPSSYKNAALGKSPPKETESNSDSPMSKQKPKLQSGSRGKETEAAPPKPKLRTMDMDAFEVIDSAEMGKLFTPTPSTPNEKSTKPIAPLNRTDLLFQSDDEMESDITTLQQVSALPKQPTISELMERVSLLESDLSSKKKELSKMGEEKDLLSLQNQELHDRFSQIKMKSNVEISTWKKNSEEVQDQLKMAKNNMECYRNQKEGELRKVMMEKSRLQEDLKSFSMKEDSLQLTIDQLNSSKDQFEEEVNQKSIQLAEQQIQMMKYQETAQVLDARARDAESKYLSMKSNLIKMNLEKTKKRLTAEVNKMHELQLDASDQTQPSKGEILRSMRDWDEVIAKINTSLHAVTEDGQKLVEYIRMGRPLSTLPPGDLQIPSIPDLTVAHLLRVGKAGDAKGLDNNNKPVDLMSLNTFSNQASQLGGLASGRTLSLGQLGITPTMESSHLDDGMHGDGPPSGRGNGGGPMQPHQPHQPNLVMGPPMRHHHHHHHMGMSGPPPPQPPPPPRMSEPHTGFMNGLAPSLPSFIAEDMGKGGSSNSSPIPVPMPPMTSLSGSNDYTSTYSMVKKPPCSASNQIFVGQLPWNFSDEHLKALFSKFDVVSADIQENGNSKDGKPVSKYGVFTFLTKRERDHALQAGMCRYLQSKPLSYGNMNMPAKEIKRPSKLIPSSPQPNLGHVPDLPLIPPSSLSSLNHAGSHSPSIAKQMGMGSAYGLQSLVEAGNRGEPRTVATPTTPTATKPKFQNLRSTNNMGAIGTPPPKVVRPIPRPGNTKIGTMTGGLQSMAKDDTMITSAAYKRLMEGYKQKFGNEHSNALISKAIREVREQNKNSLSGLALDTILDQVDAQLRIHKRMPPKPSVAPWAQLTQSESMDAPWQPPILGLDVTSDDQCAICLEMLNSSPTQRLSCQHVFHINCIKDWLSRKSDCPICRKFDLNKDEYPSLRHG